MREAAKTRIRKAIEVFFRRSDSILIVESVFACLLLFIIIFFLKKGGFTLQTSLLPRRWQKA